MTDDATHTTDEATTTDAAAPAAPDAPAEKVDTIYVDYVCPSHGTIHTANLSDTDSDVLPVELLCAKVSGEGPDAQICTQTARWRTRRGEMPSVAHPSGGEAPGVQPPQP